MPGVSQTRARRVGASGGRASGSRSGSARVGVEVGVGVGWARVGVANARAFAERARNGDHITGKTARTRQERARLRGGAPETPNAAPVNRSRPAQPSPSSLPQHHSPPQTRAHSLNAREMATESPAKLRAPDKSARVCEEMRPRHPQRSPREPSPTRTAQPRPGSLPQHHSPPQTRAHSLNAREMATELPAKLRAPDKSARVCEQTGPKLRAPDKGARVCEEMSGRNVKRI